MKKIIGIIVSIIFIAGALILFSGNKIITLGSTKYYVKTISDYKADPNNRYEYKIKGYDKEGEEKLITFTTDKVLKFDRYLKVYVKDDITKSYEEVQVDELPDKVKEIYGVK